MLTAYAPPVQHLQTMTENDGAMAAAFPSRLADEVHAVLSLFSMV